MVNLYLVLLGVFCSVGLVEQQPRALYNSTALIAAADLVQSDTLKATARNTEKKKSRQKKSKREPAAARVTMKRDVNRVSLSQVDPEGYNVEIVIMDSGLALRNPEDLQLVGSSGNSIDNSSYMGFQNIVLPFEGSIRFKAPNKMKNTLYDREVKFEINKPGRWVLRLDL